MKYLKNLLLELNDYSEAAQLVGNKGTITEISGCVDPSKLHIVHGLSDGRKHTLIVTFSEQRAKEISDDYGFYLALNDENAINALFYPARDLMFFQADVHGNLLTKQRIKCLKPLGEGANCTIVTTFNALMERIAPSEVIYEHVMELSVGDDVSLTELASELTVLGYERSYQVEDSGQFSIRGGIIDIFPLTDDNPVRIELFGDEIESIRSFDVLSQRSIEKHSEIWIYPASEIVLTGSNKEKAMECISKELKKYEKKLRGEFKTEEAHRLKLHVEEILEKLQYGNFSGMCLENFVNYFYEETSSILDYFDENNTLLVLDEPSRLMELAAASEFEYRDSMEQRLLKGYILPGESKVLYSKDEIMAKIHRFSTVALSSLPVGKTVYRPDYQKTLATRAMNSYNNSFESLSKDLLKYKKSGYRVIVVSASRTRGKRLAEDLRNDFEVRAFYSENMENDLKPGEVMITYGRIHQGFEYPLIKFAVISESDIFTSEKKKKKRTAYTGGQKIADYSELNVGDFVVHESHGLGVYKGIEQLRVDHITKDYITIEYSDGGKLYIPATALDAIQKYSSKEGTVPKLNRLGGNEWNKTKSKVKTAIDVIANDLVELYATRQEKEGFMYSEDTLWQREFEERFPFEETEDQLAAIEQTKKDMQSHKIMDRLICGDVGYGKTEIAIRAAFKAIQDGKQVAYLVPTTILAGQHLSTFQQRMKDYPVRIECLSRFRTPTEIKNTLSDLKKGLVDVVIGTHRLLSKDVVFKDLGLLIIDEEQRFGVRHKETIKQMRENVDVLTLTATPIPRTLHMSLIGIRDMSVLEEPPQDRMPIQTYVCEYNEELVREAINRELLRNGQVFYVYNRVNTIVEMTAFIQKLVPDANVAFAHGQMKERELERIMYDFINGEIDVLVSTTIIETGLDISNVNTMIIHDSDQMGLSQLYQLRGRVGRSNRTAYAFLMYKKDKMLKEIAEKRLQAIRDFTELGSGFKIAMRDLEIRGAGNLLGERQSGHMAAVGYDLYCKMLNEAIKSKKGMDNEEEWQVSVDIAVDAYIPDSYIMNENQKIDIYKRIASIESENERTEMEEELADRFGVLPRSVVNLFEVANMRILAGKVYVTEITCEDRTVKLLLYEKARFVNEKIAPFLHGYKGKLVFRSGTKPYFLYRFDKGGNYENEKLLRFIDELLIDMQQLLEVQS